jgi:hypothetical protein
MNSHRATRKPPTIFRLGHASQRRIAMKLKKFAHSIVASTIFMSVLLPTTALAQGGAQVPHLFYTDNASRLNHIWFQNSAWHREDLTTRLGVSGGMFATGYTCCTGVNRIFFANGNGNGNIMSAAWTAGTGWALFDVTNGCNCGLAGLAAGPVTSNQFNGNDNVYFTGTNGHLYRITGIVSNGKENWSGQDLTQASGFLAMGDSVSTVSQISRISPGGTIGNNIYFISLNQAIWELHSTNNTTWSVSQIPVGSSVPGPQLCSGEEFGSKDVFYNPVSSTTGGVFLSKQPDNSGWQAPINLTTSTNGAGDTGTFMSCAIDTPNGTTGVKFVTYIGTNNFFEDLNRQVTGSSFKFLAGTNCTQFCAQETATVNSGSQFGTSQSVSIAITAANGIQQNYLFFANNNLHPAVFAWQGNALPASWNFSDLGALLGGNTTDGYGMTGFYETN